MPTSRSRYRAAGDPDYSHRFHAGNVGDVWKHCVLLDVLRKTAASAARVAYLETHAGEGRYALAPTGEWTEGIGRLWDPELAEPHGDAFSDYVASLRTLGAGDERPKACPGSPAFARSALGADATLMLYERDEHACERLRSAMQDDARAHVRCGDGLTELRDALCAAESHDGHEAVIALVDPPYTEKADWISVPDALARAAQESTRASLLLWYPVKSLTRPNAMIARLEAAGVRATAAELITTPLAHQRQRLNGSGMILVRPPVGAIESIAASAAAIGPRCATRAGSWSFRIVSW